ncbi:isoamylase early set domain-containing protein [Chloroflexota bacterium]
MITKKPVENTALVRVTFELPSTMWAERVNLVGDFSDWDTTATPMTHNRSDANWKVSLDLAAGRRYRFRYLVDGKEQLPACRQNGGSRPVAGRPGQVNPDETHALRFGGIFRSGQVNHRIV